MTFVDARKASAAGARQQRAATVESFISEVHEVFV